MVKALKPRGRNKAPAVAMDIPSDDDIDVFNRNRNTVNLTPEDDNSSEDDDEYNLGVNDYDLGDLGSSDDNDNEGTAANIGDAWGKHKKVYYDEEDSGDEDDDNNIENSDAEEERRLEEEEVLRIQKKHAAKMKASDYVDEENTLADLVHKKSQNNHKELKMKLNKKEKLIRDGENKIDLLRLEPSHPESNSSRKALENLPTDEKLRILNHDAPELRSLLMDLINQIHELRERIAPIADSLKTQIKENQSGGGQHEAEGHSYLELKLQIMVSYCTNISFYLLLKAKGAQVVDHPVMARLVEHRVLMEKLKPIDRRLKSQLERMLNLANDEQQVVEDDLTQYRPNLDLMTVGDDDFIEGKNNDSEEDSDVYRAPRIASVPYEGDCKGRANRRDREMLARAQKSDLLAELQNEIGDEPELEKFEGSRSREEIEEEAQRLRYEENMFLRLPEPSDRIKRKKERDRLTTVTDHSLSLERFNNLSGDLEEAGKEMDDQFRSVMKKKSIRERVGEMLSLRNATGSQRDGDADVPYQDYAAMQSAADRRRAKEKDRSGSRAEDGDHSLDRDPGPLDDDDDFYKEAASKRENKKRQKIDRREASQFFVGEDRDVVDGDKRGASSTIVKNTGLKTYRKKEDKNPRKHMRNKFTKKMKSAVGVTAPMRVKEHVYTGEKTGIKDNITKSAKLSGY